MSSPFTYPPLEPFKRPDFTFPISKTELYNSFTPDLIEARQRARILMHKFNHSVPEPSTATLGLNEGSERKRLLAELFGMEVEKMGEVYIEPPFAVDYGFNIILAGDFYANYNTIILDCSKVYIGKRVLFGPNVSIYAAGHGTSVVERLTGDERAGEVRIGDDTWIGGSVSIQAGVSIGQGCTVGAGAVVTKSFPDWSVIYGNPARLVKVVPEDERGPGWDAKKGKEEEGL